jgi:aryl-alcohol dehydrogenase-like predicted oxidoreductase
MERRLFRDGVELSIIGFPGLMLVGMEQATVNRLVAAAVARGINYFDVAPAYGDGEAETKLGAALAPYRRQTFLACKTLERDGGNARRELEESLRHLRTDSLDLYSFHAVTEREDVERIFSPGGAAEAFFKARTEGKVRYVGFSAHSVTAAVAMLDRCTFDCVLFPVNFVCYARGNFGPQIINRAAESGVSRIALKAMALTRRRGRQRDAFPNCWYQPIEDEKLARQALRFALSEDVTAALPPADEWLFRLAVDAAQGFSPLTSEERRQLTAKAGRIRPIMAFSHRSSHI